jgi:hypothetical protein
VWDLGTIVRMNAPKKPPTNLRAKPDAMYFVTVMMDDTELHAEMPDSGTSEDMMMAEDRAIEWALSHRGRMKGLKLGRRLIPLL